MNRTATACPAPPAVRTGRLSRRATGLLLRGPATLTSTAARWSVTALAVAGAALLVWSGVIHLQLWSDGYRDISIIGPLFLAQAIASMVLAVALVAFRRLALLAAGAALALSTAAGLLLAASTGLFGYTESLAVPYAGLSLAVDFTAAAVLTVASALLLAGPHLNRR